jgi:hypothetical protein
LDICVCLPQVSNVSFLIRTQLLFQDLDVLMGFTFIRAEEQEIGFPGTLGIRNHDFWRDGGFHDDAPQE